MTESISKSTIGTQTDSDFDSNGKKKEIGIVSTPSLDRKFGQKNAEVQAEIPSGKEKTEVSDHGVQPSDPFETETEVQTNFSDSDKDVAVNLMAIGSFGNSFGNSFGTSFEENPSCEPLKRKMSVWSFETPCQTKFPVEPVEKSTQTWMVMRSIRLQTKDAFLQQRASIFLGPDAGPLLPPNFLLERSNSYHRRDSLSPSPSPLATRRNTRF